jgi:hypothetical protein
VRVWRPCSLAYRGPSPAFYSCAASVSHLWSLIFYIGHIHHHRRFLLRQHGRNLLGIGRNYRFYQSSHRVPYLRSCLASRFYHRVCISSIDSAILTNRLGSPLIGGAFSSPASSFPNLFSHDFFRTYPYFLPGCIASILSVIGAVFGYVFLEEVSSPHTFPILCLLAIVDSAEQTSRTSCVQVDHRGSPGTKIGTIHFPDAYLRAYYTCP